MHLQRFAVASLSLNFLSYFFSQAQRIGFRNTSPKNTWALRATRSNDLDLITLQYAFSLAPNAIQWLDLSYLKHETNQTQEDFIYQVCDTTGKAAILYVNGDLYKCAVYSGAKINVSVTIDGITVQTTAGAEISELNISDNINSLYNISAIPLPPKTCVLPNQNPATKKILVNFDNATQFEPRSHYPCDALPYTQQYVNTIRLGFTWEYIQNFLGQNIPIDWSEGGYAAHLLMLVDAWQNLTVILTMYDHMRYSYCTIGTLDCWIKDQRYMHAWQDIAKHFMNYSTVIFDLMHQPEVNVGKLSTDITLRNQNLATQAIRAAGAKNLILFEGNHQSNLETWADNNDGRANNLVFLPRNIRDSYYALSISSSCTASSTAVTQRKFSFWLEITQSSAIITQLDAKNTNQTACIEAMIIWALAQKHIEGVDVSNLPGLVTSTNQTSVKNTDGYPNIPLLLTDYRHKSLQLDIAWLCDLGIIGGVMLLALFLSYQLYKASHTCFKFFCEKKEEVTERLLSQSSEAAARI